MRYVLCIEVLSISIARYYPTKGHRGADFHRRMCMYYGQIGDSLNSTTLNTKYKETSNLVVSAILRLPFQMIDYDYVKLN